MIEPQIFNRVKALVAGDKRDMISPFAFHSSLFEEIGELAAALKVETGIVTHKTLDEPARSEAVDVYICAAMMYFHEGFRELPNIANFTLSDNILILSDTEYDLNKVDPFQLLVDMNYHVHKAIVSNDNGFNKMFHWTEIGRLATVIFFKMGGSLGEFTSIGNKKLNKWEKNQAIRNRIYRELSEEKLDALKARFDAKSWDETADGDRNLMRPPLKGNLTCQLSQNVERIIERK